MMAEFSESTRKGQAVFISAIYDPATDVGLDAKVFLDGPDSEEYLAWAEQTYDPALESIEVWTTPWNFARLYPWAKEFLGPSHET